MQSNPKMTEVYGSNVQKVNHMFTSESSRFFASAETPARLPPVSMRPKSSTRSMMSLSAQLLFVRLWTCGAS